MIERILLFIKAFKEFLEYKIEKDGVSNAEIIAEIKKLRDELYAIKDAFLFNYYLKNIRPRKEDGINENVNS